MNSSTKTVLIIAAILILCVVCLCLVMIGAGVIFSRSVISTAIPMMETPFSFSEATPTPFVDPGSQALDPTGFEKASQTLDELNLSTVPINDPIDLAARLGGKPNVPDVLIDAEAPYSVGAQKTFWATNTDTNDNFKVTATLRYVGDNIYFWIENGVRFDQTELKNLADTFDQEIIPTNREFFGQEWNPGVDGDPRFYVLYAGNLGMNLAGYYSSADELHPDAHPYSNAHEMFLLSSDNVDLGDSYIYGTMAHEFQHMIHWYKDKNEETWVNEGFSMLAEHVNEYDAGGFDWSYMDNPDMQLNDWGGDIGDNGPHYGASYLFMVYFLDRFGEDATKALVRHDENGFVGIEKVLNELSLTNATTGKPYSGNEFFADWAVANLLQDKGIEGGRYDYQSYNPTSVDMEKSVLDCPVTVDGSVYQFGVDYIEIQCDNLQSIQINASEAVNLLPFTAPSSGEYFVWSNVGDESNASLSQTFDLSNATGETALTFKTWYDLEEDYDYIYISASTDGTNWEILNSENCTTTNPSGNSYGCGWNGATAGWIDEKVDLSKFVGGQVTLRFDYVTDAAVNGKGMAIDDLAIDAIGYSTDLENDLGGWTAEGFVRVQNRLPQILNVSIVTYTSGGVTVDHRSFQGEIQISGAELGGPDVERIVLVISGTTPFTREKANYTIGLE
jgi:immune inhibitor A